MMRRGGEERGPGRRQAPRGAIRRTAMRLLGERPMHGYELMAEFESRSGGQWKPSPGSIYPTLARLEEEGLVQSTEQEGRRQFELTADGRAWLTEHPAGDEAPPWDRPGAGRRGDLRRLQGEVFGQLGQLARFGTASQLEQAHELLDRVRIELYSVLSSRDDDG